MSLVEDQRTDRELDDYELGPDPGHGRCELQDCGRRICIGHKAGRSSVCTGGDYEQGIVIDGLAFCDHPCAGIVADETVPFDGEAV